MIGAVVFDLYGTLIRLDRDTSPYLQFARRVRPEDPRCVVLASLLTETRGLRDFAERLGISPPADVEELEADLERDVRSARVFEDVADALAALRGRGLKLGLISNLATPYKEPFFRLSLAGLFDAALFSCDLGLRKPEPGIYLRMMEALGVRPAEALMVGDSPRSDDEGPRAVGMEALLLRRGGSGRDARSIVSLGELPGLIPS
jgi:HAD superfamily hydrolase (TIGR01509 family)